MIVVFIGRNFMGPGRPHAYWRRQRGGQNFALNAHCDLTGTGGLGRTVAASESTMVLVTRRAGGDANA
jgi:hypothetical protein